MKHMGNDEMRARAQLPAQEALLHSLGRPGQLQDGHHNNFLADYFCQNPLSAAARASNRGVFAILKGERR